MLSKSLDKVIPSKNSFNEFSANSFSNSMATVKNSSKLAILFSASMVFSSSNDFVYPDFLSVCLINSEMVRFSFLLFKSSMMLINSLEFKNTRFSPYSSAFFMISYIDVSFKMASCSILSKLVFPIPLFGSLIILFKLRLSLLF